MNKEAVKGLAEYREKIRTGEIERKERLTPYQKAEQNPRSYKWAVVAKCFECSGDQRAEVTKCKVVECPLWNLRPWQGRHETKEGLDSDNTFEEDAEDES